MTGAIDQRDRARLVAVAYRLLGSTHDAEDAVQEAILRWQQLGEPQRAGIREPQAWLTTVVSRICFDQLRSARARREQYRGIWLPEPQLADGGSPTDPADAVTLDDTVSYAFLVALEKLSPAERVSFILHDAFGLPFAEIARTVGRTPAACRQLAVSARRHLVDEPRYDVPGAERDRVVAAFLDACRGGDLGRLVAVLDPDVVSVADGGERVAAARRPVVGAATVAAYLLRVLGTLRRRVPGEPVIGMEPVNGRTGLVIRAGGTVLGTVDLAVADGRVARIAIQVNPDKLPRRSQGSGPVR